MNATLLLLASALVVLPTGARARTRLRHPVANGPEPGAGRPDPHATAGSLDLLAACLRAGLDIGSAAAAVAPVAPEPFAGSLRRAAQLLGLGAEPDAAWASLAAVPDTEPVARAILRSARSGTSMADAMADAATDLRARADDAATAAGERAGVLVSGPLGLCFLPAFVCLGIVPVVIGLAGSVLNGGVL